MSSLPYFDLPEVSFEKQQARDAGACLGHVLEPGAVKAKQVGRPLKPLHRQKRRRAATCFA